MRSSVGATIIAGLASLAATAEAWGPLSHLTFACEAVQTGSSLPECYQQRPTFSASTDLPDAFGFGAFNITDDPSYLCKNLTYVHDLEFGGYLILQAQSQLDAARQTGDEVAAAVASENLEMAYGFSAHIVGDYVGFNPAKGILCTREAVACDATNIRYMPIWSYMTDLDAYYYGSRGMVAQDLPMLSGLVQSTFTFLEEMSVSFNAQNAKFKPFTAVAAEQCVNYWVSNVKYVADKSSYFKSAQQALINEISWFAPSGTYNATAYMESQAACASAAISHFFQNLLESNDPAGSVQDVAQFIGSLYSAGKCVDGRTF